MKFSDKQISNVLKDIHSRIPSNLMKNVVKEVKATPTVERIVLAALKSKAFPESKKQALRTLLEAGQFSKKKVVENKKIAKLIEQFVSREINKAIKDGKLPPKKEIKNMEHFKKIMSLHGQKTDN